MVTSNFLHFALPEMKLSLYKFRYLSLIKENLEFRQLRGIIRIST